MQNLLHAKNGVITGFHIGLTMILLRADMTIRRIDFQQAYSSELLF